MVRIWHLLSIYRKKKLKSKFQIYRHLKTSVNLLGFFYENILSRNKENFIRFIIRSNNSFVFQQLLNENYKKWIKDIKNYKFKNFIYKNYIYFLKDFCLFNESIQCLNTLNYFLDKHNLCQNQPKKNTVRNIRWII
jgi:hypothetical protein